MGAHRDRDQAEGDVCERLESAEGGLSEEVHSGAPDQYAADDLTRDSGESEAARQGAEENTCDEDDCEQKQRSSVTQRFHDWIHRRVSLVMATRDQTYRAVSWDSRRI